MCNESIVKPCRSRGSRWASHKLAALKAVVRNYCSIISHFQDMASDQRPDIKPDEVCRLKGYLKKRKFLAFLYHCSFYVDVLEKISLMSLIFHSDDTMFYCVAEQMDSAIAALHR